MAVVGNTTTYIIQLDAEDYHSDLMAIYIWPFILVVICTILGVFGNTAVLYIYACRWVRTKTVVFFISLGVLNLVNSAVNMPIEAVILWRPLDFDYHWMCKLSRGLTFIINNVCACVFVAIAIDRILLVYRPLRRRVLTIRYAKISCVVAFLVGLATSWPGFVFYGSATLIEDIDGRQIVGKTCYLSDYFMQDTKWPRLFIVVLLVLMVSVFLILTVMYIFIGKKIYTVTRNDSVGTEEKFTTPAESLIRGIRLFRLFSKTEKVGKGINKNGIKPVLAGNGESGSTKRNSNPGLGRRVSGSSIRASKENTKTLLLVTFAYIVSFLPYVVIAILRSKDARFYSDLDKRDRIAYHVFLRFYFLNSAVNPFIYSFSNTQFRNKIKLVACDMRRYIEAKIR